MTPLARAFVAVYPPPDVVDSLEERLVHARAAVSELRWDPSDRWHVTVRFLGRVADSDALTAALRTSLKSIGAFPVELAGAGAFPTARRGSVLWVGVKEPDGALGELAGRVERACVVAGLAREDRPFHPHVTVARAAGTRDLRALVDAIGAGVIGGPWTVGDVRLMQSDTRASGAVHSELARVGLGGEGGLGG